MPGGPHFLALGDWGGSELWPYTTPPQIETAAGMSTVASVRNSSFVVALGDNFYSRGIRPGSSRKAESDARKRFERTFGDAYGDDDSLKGVPWYVTAGNHDHLGNVTAQMEFGRIDGRWVYPELFYSIRKDFTVNMASAEDDDDDDGNDDVADIDATTTTTASVEIVMIDTVTLAGLNTETSSSSPTYFDPPPGPADPRLSSSKLEWIDRTLRASSADYLFVAGHYPVYSACRHGNTPYLIKHLEPLLRRYGATGYLSGHDHCQMHIRRGGMEYVLTGTGDGCCYDASNLRKLPDDAELMYLLSEDRNPHGARGGFAGFEIVGTKGRSGGSGSGSGRTTSSATVMKVRLHDEGGGVLYETRFSPRKAKVRFDDGGEVTAEEA